jgi:hypothetical protein
MAPSDMAAGFDVMLAKTANALIDDLAAARPPEDRQAIETMVRCHIDNAREVVDDYFACVGSAHNNTRPSLTGYRCGAEGTSLPSV